MHIKNTSKEQANNPLHGIKLAEILKFMVAKYGWDKLDACGPLFTQEFSNYPLIDHFILNEAEITLPPFLKDIETGQLPKKYTKQKNMLILH